MLGAGDVTGTAAVKVAIRVSGGVELEGIGVLQHFVENGLVFSFGPVTEMDAIRFGELGRLFDPGFHRRSHGVPPPQKNRCNASTEQINDPDPTGPRRAKPGGMRLRYAFRQFKVGVGWVARHDPKSGEAHYNFGTVRASIRARNYSQRSAMFGSILVARCAGM